MVVPAGTGKTASRLRALLMPLSVVECEATIRPGRELHTMSNVRAERALHGVYTHPLKGSLAMFLAEVLGVVLRDGPADGLVWNFVAGSVAELDGMPVERVANFHICFLYGLAECLGIAPDVGEYRQGMVFDMADGRFRATPPLHPHFLGAKESAAVWAVSRLSYSNMHAWRMNRQERQQVLDAMLQFYTLHYASMTSLKSLDVLRSLM